MGLKFNKLVPDRKTLTINLDGNKLKIEYNPQMRSPKALKELAEAQKAYLETIEEEDDKQMEMLTVYANSFCNIVTGWDLVGELGDIPEDEPVPCTPEYVLMIPMEYTDAILKRIGEAHTPK